MSNDTEHRPAIELLVPTQTPGQRVVDAPVQAPEAAPNKRKSLMLRIGLPLAVIATGGALFLGLKDNASATPENTSTPTTATAEATPAPDEVEQLDPALAETRRSYEAFVAALTPEQKVVLDKLSPDNIANMSDSEIVESAKIYLDEVSDGNGGVDLEKYANSVALRMGALNKGGCSSVTFDKYDGAVNMPLDEVTAMSEQYVDDGARGLFDREGGESNATLYRCMQTQSVIDLGADIAPYESYSYLSNVNTAPESNTVDFTIEFHDNYNEEALSEYLGSTPSGGIANLSTTTAHLAGVHVESDGRVLPTDVSGR